MSGKHAPRTRRTQVLPILSPPCPPPPRPARPGAHLYHSPPPHPARPLHGGWYHFPPSSAFWLGDVAAVGPGLCLWLCFGCRSPCEHFPSHLPLTCEHAVSMPAVGTSTWVTGPVSSRGLSPHTPPPTLRRPRDLTEPLTSPPHGHSAFSEILDLRLHLPWGAGAPSPSTVLWVSRATRGPSTRSEYSAEPQGPCRACTRFLRGIADGRAAQLPLRTRRGWCRRQSRAGGRKASDRRAHHSCEGYDSWGGRHPRPGDCTVGCVSTKVNYLALWDRAGALATRCLGSPVREGSTSLWFALHRRCRRPY